MQVVTSLERKIDERGADTLCDEWHLSKSMGFKEMMA